jgi:hypothetical protein
MSTDRQKEIDRNLEYFMGELPKLLQHHRNRYVLLKDRAIVGIYDTVRDAQTAGDRIFPDHIFSIQKVTNQSVDLGFFSHAGSIR